MPEFLLKYLQAFAGQISKKIIAIAVMIFLIILSVIMIYLGLNALLLVALKYLNFSLLGITGIFLLTHAILLAIFYFVIKRALTTWNVEVDSEDQKLIEEDPQYDAHQLINDGTNLISQIIQNLDSPTLIIKNLIKMKSILFAYAQSIIVKIIKKFYKKRKVSST